MSTEDLTGHLAQAFTPAPGHLARLHEHLAGAAQADGILDVAYRIIDTPVGPLLLAATDQGLVRVAFAREDHDAVLQSLADRISPRVLPLPGPTGRRPSASSMSISPASGTASTCRWTGGCRPASAGPS